MENRPLKSESAKRTDRSISVFFPCFNEQDTVEPLTGKAVEVLSRLSNDYEIIIVNDGSTDRTASVAEKLAREIPQVKIVNHPANLGYGAALQSGFRAATKELVFYTDGDGQFDINELEGILPLIEQYDIVSCYRTNRQDGLLRKFNAWCWTKLVCALFGLRLRDIDCAFKLYRRNIFDNMPLCSTGAMIDTEVLARAVRAGCTITQAPVRHYPRVTGKATGAKLKVILKAFSELLTLYRELKKESV